MPEKRPCPDCKENPATPPHLCPLKDEVWDDHTPCECCPDCMEECRMSI
jgi:hypothetical protein